MEKYVVDILFTEILNRHQRFFISLIRDKFEGDEVHDVYQDVCLHLYQILNKHWNNQQDLFNSKASTFLSGNCVFINETPSLFVLATLYLSKSSSSE